MISEKDHPELARALNNMTTVISRDHTEAQWKHAMCRMFYALAEEIVKPPMIIVNAGPVSEGQAP